MHYEYRVVIEATNGKEVRDFCVERTDNRAMLKYEDALAARGNLTAEIGLRGWHTLCSVIQSRRVEDWGRHDNATSLIPDIDSVLRDHALLVRRMDAIGLACQRERKNIENIQPQAVNADFLLGELSQFVREIDNTQKGIQ